MTFVNDHFDLDPIDDTTDQKAKTESAISKKPKHTESNSISSGPQIQSTRKNSKGTNKDKDKNKDKKNMIDYNKNEPLSPYKAVTKEELIYRKASKELRDNSIKTDLAKSPKKKTHKSSNDLSNGGINGVHKEHKELKEKVSVKSKTLTLGKSTAQPLGNAEAMDHVEDLED